ncbi:terminase small subunit [Vibrio phage vB_VchM_Kuja]|uniref:Terminase small subunit n=1 Tax=Vibrio phage vB_VchM_Kuja TaxID=2686437 RepID=A0A6B9J9L2_9CAUD|nr:terminase small subunit [Vibrio phage vB_VchM_Kuja]QGZ16169.1 terminase small subunit [Vibrio phage vB_VchM_Kuja]
MDELTNRLLNTLKSVEAEEFAVQSISRETLDENRRQLMDPSEFGGADDVDDDYTPIEIPDLVIEEKESQAEDIPGTDLQTDHKYVRNVNYGLSKLYLNVIPVLVKGFANTENPRCIAALNETVEQLRKIHNDMLNSSKLSVETKIKAKPTTNLSDRFDEGGTTTTTTVEVDGKKVTVATTARRLDMMAMLVKGFGGNMNDVPDEAYERLDAGEDPRSILEDFKKRTLEGEIEEADIDNEEGELDA